MSTAWGRCCCFRGRGYYSCRWRSGSSSFFEAPSSLQAKLRHLVIAPLSCRHRVGGGNGESSLGACGKVGRAMIACRPVVMAVVCPSPSSSLFVCPCGFAGFFLFLALLTLALLSLGLSLVCFCYGLGFTPLLLKQFVPGFLYRV